MSAETTIVRVTLRLASPVLLPQEQLLFGDALLLTAWLKQQFPDTWMSRKPSQWTKPDLPVVWDNKGFWRVSCVSIADAEPGRTTLVKLVDDQALLTFDPALGKYTPPIHGYRPKQEGGMVAFRGNVVPLKTLSAETAEFLVEVPNARLDEFKEILGGLSGVSVGGGAHRGFGAVSRVSAAVVDQDSAIFSPDGVPLRPIPVASSNEKVPGSHLRVMRIAPPYWYGPRVLTICPSVDRMIQWRPPKRRQFNESRSAGLAVPVSPGDN